MAPIAGEDIAESSTPLPNLLLLNNEGILSSWWFVYNEPCGGLGGIITSQWLIRSRDQAYVGRSGGRYNKDILQMRFVVSETREELVGRGALEAKWHTQFRQFLDQERRILPSGDDIVRGRWCLAHIILHSIRCVDHQEDVILKPGDRGHCTG